MNKFENEMYEFLKNGGDMEAYLNTITQAANAANARIQEEKEKEREKAKAKKNIVQDADNMLATVRNFFHTYYPEVKIDLTGDEKPLTGEEFVDLLENLRPLFPMLNTLISVEIENADRRRSATDPIEDFLDKFVRSK